MSTDAVKPEISGADFAAAAPAPVLARPEPAALRWLGAAVDAAVILIGGFMVCLVFTNVVLHLFGRDLAWVTELGELLMVWVTFLGGVCAARRGAHMNITELLDKLQPAARRWADAAIGVLCLAMLAMLAWYGWRIVQSSWNNMLTTLEWPMAWQYMPLPLGAALMFVFQGWDLVQTLQGVPREQRYPAE